MIRRRVSLETKINHERWLVSYSDFITLLFAFFVVMYSVSQVNENKYRVLSDTLQAAFKPAQQPGQQEAQQDGQLQERQALISMNDLQSSLNEALLGLIASNAVIVSGNEDWVELEINANVLFDSGSATPSTEAKNIFSQVADVLAPYENAVAVAGHTDNIPIRNGRYQNNWELSSARAVSVVNLLAYDGVSPDRLSATGYGEFQPLADNATVEGRARNRRVVLRVARERREAPTASATALMAESGTEQIPLQGSEQSQTSDVEVVTTPVAEQVAPASEIQPIKLPNGGLLFTSDPKGRGVKE